MHPTDGLRETIYSADTNNRNTGLVYINDN